MVTTMDYTQLIARSKTGLESFMISNGKCGEPKALTGEQVRQSRFSLDGSCLAVAFATHVAIYNVLPVADQSESMAIQERCLVSISCADFALSPSGKYLATFEKPVNDNTKQHFNMAIWKIIGNDEPIRLGVFSHKTQSTWSPQWTADENYIGRMTSSEVQFYKSESFDRISFKVQKDGIGAFAISPGSYPKVAIFTKESKGQPGGVKVFLLPNTSLPVAQKMFFKADKCSLQWSPNGKHLLAMSQTEVDSTGISYYGETKLYFVSGDGSFDCRIDLDKEGPIHDFAWSPLSSEFVIIYGYMPTKSVLFNLKCESVFEFPVGSKNHVRWNPQGSLICFGGFGNLPGQVEIWSRTGAIRRVGHFQSQGSAICEWDPSGTRLVTATLTPRLRVDNNCKFWNWDGTMFGHFPYTELYAVAWRPMDCKLFVPADFSSVPTTACGLLVTEAAIKSQVYRPPGLRNQQAKPSVSNTASTAPAKAAPVIGVPSSLSKEEKQVKKLKEKMDQIAELKEKLKAGKQLELNQLEKIKKADEIAKEYEKALKNLDSLHL